jgi:hypothetical protein
MESPVLQKLAPNELTVKWSYGFKKQSRNEFPPKVSEPSSQLTLAVKPDHRGPLQKYEGGEGRTYNF